MMRRLAVWLVAAVGWAIGGGAEAKDPIADSVVKIYVTRREPDFVRPWNKANPQEAAGSGVVIAGKQILTNAHMVRYASQVLVQANQSTEKVPAKVKAVAHGMDLAVLQIDEPGFFDQRPAVPVAQELPSLKQTVSVYGYPIGGEQISVTQGIVSRIEYSHFYFSIAGLRIQIDAALNPGNSGGPAITGGKIIGLVCSRIAQAENIGYLIAAEEIAMFLADAQDGTYHGKPVLWDVFVPTENEALRAKLGLGKEAGMLVWEPFSLAPDWPLKKWDVITRIGDQPLDSQGSVKVKDDLKLYFEYLVPKLAKDGHVKLTVFRDRKTADLSAPVRAEAKLLVPFLKGEYPRYFIYGPMVFSQATQDLVFGLAGSWASRMTMVKNPLLGRAMDQPAFAGEEIVTLGVGLRPHRTSKGYSPPPFSVVTHVNGTAVRNLAHVVELLRDAKGEFLTIDLAGRSGPLVFRREEVLKATEDVLTDDSIRKQYSDDLEPIWHPKK